jgi:hypothetical protein
MSDAPGYWEVVEDYESEREGLLSVRAGQLVEVLDDSGSNWMVLTIAMATGDLETEGFLPAHILRPAGTPLCMCYNVTFVELVVYV